MLKYVLAKFKELLGKTRKWMWPEEGPFYPVRYTSVPVWKPWRDF